MENHLGFALGLCCGSQTCPEVVNFALNVCADYHLWADFQVIAT